MSAAAAPSDASLVPAYVPLRRRARALAVLLIAIALAGWFAVGFDLAEVRLWARERVGAEIASSERAAHGRIRGLVAPLQAALGAAAAGAFLLWIHLARRNLRALGARRLAHPTRWAVLGFLVPGLNLWRPYQVMGEIWRASDPSLRDPFAWKRLRVPWLLRLWWAATLVFAASALLAALTGGTAGRDAVRVGVSLGVELTADLAAAVAASLGYFVVVRISQAQEAKHRLRAGAAPGAAAAPLAPAASEPTAPG